MQMQMRMQTTFIKSCSKHLTQTPGVEYAGSPQAELLACLAEVHASAKGIGKLCSTHQGRGASGEMETQASEYTISTSGGSHEQCNVYDGKEIGTQLQDSRCVSN